MELQSLSSYKQVRLIGNGYFSNVIHYCSEHFPNDIAVKILKKEHLENDDYVHRFEREIDIIDLLLN